MRKTLIFYPYFPKYRRRILSELSHSKKMDTTIASGRKGRGGIEPLTKGDLPDLEELREIRFGPISLHPDIIRRVTLTDFDIVVMAPATLSVSVWAVLVARRVTGRPTVLWGQCGRPGERGLKRIAQEVMNRLATKLLVYGEMERVSAGELGTPMTKITSVGNASDHNSMISSLSSVEFQKKAEGRGIGTNAKSQRIHLLYVGRVTKKKKLDRLISCIEVLQRQGYEIEASIVGEGDAKADLQTMARHKSLCVDFPGALYTDEERQTYFDRAHIVVAPNSVGLLAIDALNNGLPVIYPETSDGNGPEVEALSNRLNALPFAELSADSLAKAIITWLEIAPTIKLDEYERAAREASEEWSAAGVAKRIEGALIDI